MVRIERLNKNFGSNHVLKDISIKITKGEIYGLVGRSGVGKSTLLRCINGLEKFDSGSLYIGGESVTKKSLIEIRQMRMKIGMIFQNFSLIDRRTVYQNVALPMKCWKRSKKEINDKVLSLLDIIGLMDKKDETPITLSGGQKQRVAIARALTLDPEILLCDEPTSALDPNTAKSVLQLIRDINKKFGITVVLVTHQMNVVRNICDTISIMEDGQVVESGLVTDIFLKEPDALKKLLGKDDFSVPKHGVTISFFAYQSDTSIITSLSRCVGEDINILSANSENYQGLILVFYIVNISEKGAPIFIRELERRKLHWFYIK